MMYIVPENILHRIIGKLFHSAVVMSVCTSALHSDSSGFKSQQKHIQYVAPPWGRL